MASPTQVSKPARAPRGILFRILMILLVCLAAFLFHHQAQLDARTNIHPLLRLYDPLESSERVMERMKHPCTASLPDVGARGRYAKSGWENSLSRFVLYYNLVPFLEKRWEDVVKEDDVTVLDAGGSVFLRPFVDRIDIVKTKYPGTDLHRTSYSDNAFDAVATDQLMEHAYFPQLVMLELWRILKPGGIAIVTTCAFNPVHRGSAFGDYWRFMPDGLRMLSIPFDGGIKLCGAWGTAKVISNRARNGLLTRAETSNASEMFDDEIRRNEGSNPFTVWIVVEK